MGTYKKFFSMLLATVLAAVAPALTDNTFTLTEIFNVLTVALGAVGVLGAGNLPAGVWSFMKGYVAAASAVVVFASSAITDGWTNAETIQAILAGLGAIGVIALPGPVVAPVSTGRHAIKDI